MTVLLALVGVVVVILVVGKLGELFDDATGWVVGAIVATAVGTLLLTGTVQAFKESVTPRPAPICPYSYGCP